MKSETKFHSFLGLLALVCVLAACSSLQQRFINRAVDTVSAGTSTLFECEAPTEVRKDIGAFCAKLGICKAATSDTGTLAEAFCPTLTRPLANFLVEKPLPSNWKCKATATKEKAYEFLNGICLKLPVNEFEGDETGGAVPAAWVN